MCFIVIYMLMNNNKWFKYIIPDTYNRDSQQWVENTSQAHITHFTFNLIEFLNEKEYNMCTSVHFMYDHCTSKEPLNPVKTGCDCW